MRVACVMALALRAGSDSVRDEYVRGSVWSLMIS